jgi:hypothetical protein
VRTGSSRSRRVAGIAALLGVASPTISGCGGSVVPAAKADIDRRVAALGPPVASFDAPGAGGGTPFETGQWARYRVADQSGRPSFVTHKIVGREEGAFWMEVVTDSYAGRTIVKMLVALGEMQAPHGLPRRSRTSDKIAHSVPHRHFELRALILKSADRDVTEVPAPFLRMLAFLLPHAFSLPFPGGQAQGEGHHKTDASVPAGRFAGCIHVRADDERAAQDEGVGLFWFHPVVPLGGLVRWRSLENGATKELVAFGASGARSEL